MGICDESKESKLLKSFRKNKSGSAYAWVLSLLLMFTYSIVWFTAGWGVLEFMDSVESLNLLTSEGLTIMGLAKAVFAWHPVILFMGWILYAFAHSAKRDVRIDVTR